MPPITLWFLQASRCIRTAWLLEELGLDYEVKFSEREKGLAPPSFRKAAGGLGKFPTLQDGDVTVFESGNITEYICDTYDKDHRLLPAVGDPRRYDMLYWIHAAEGTFALHGISVLYVRWHQKTGDVAQTEEGLSKNIKADFSFFVSQLEQSKGKFLYGDEITPADMMMHFSVVFIMARELGIKSKDYPRVEQYIKDCEATESYQKAVKKTGHSLG